MKRHRRLGKTIARGAFRRGIDLHEAILLDRYRLAELAQQGRGRDDLAGLGHDNLEFHALLPGQSDDRDTEAKQRDKVGEFREVSDQGFSLRQRGGCQPFPVAAMFLYSVHRDTPEPMTTPALILLAESDTALQSRLEQALEALGHEVIIAPDMAQAIPLARSERPDVLVMGSQPSAVNWVSKLRNHVLTADLPVLVAASSAQEKLELMRAGATACLSRTLDANEIERALKTHLQDDLDFTLAPAEVVAGPARLEALAQTKLMDSPDEACFDRLTRLAQHLVGAPMALFSLVGSERQFFKSQVGLARQFATARGTDLKHSFCQWVVTSRERLVIEDTRSVAALRHNLALRYMNVNAYAGIPITASNGETIGSFCALDSTPRKWTTEELATLKDLAAITEAYVQRTPAADVARRAVESAKAIGRRFSSRLSQEEKDALKTIIREQKAFLPG